MKDTQYKKSQHDRQISLYESGFFKGCENGGSFHIRTKDGIQKLTNLDIVLKPEHGKDNLFAGIKKGALSYFRTHCITWWQEDIDGYSPTGHMLSSQNHCLNHLFMMQQDKYAILRILNTIQNRVNFKDILPNPIDGLDKESLISFEFVYNNEVLLNENRHSRGANCTSIDAVIYAKDSTGKLWLIPIEWKYTEMYDKKHPAYYKSLERYEKLPDADSNLKCWDDAVYKYDPCYELARQTLLIERIIASEDKFFPVDDYMHIVVIPKGNAELNELINREFVSTLKNPAKLIIKDPKDFVFYGLKDPKYKNLEKYLSIRYWE